MRSAISKYLEDKLAKKLNVPSVTVFLSKMNEEDIVNWPSDVELKPIKKMNLEELKRLHELAKEDKLDFSPKFIEGMTGGRKIISLGIRERKELRSGIAKYLGDKLASKLNVPSMQVPWSEMTAEDIINWPQGVEFRTVWHIGTEELKTLQRLAKEDLLDFSQEFLSRLKIQMNPEKIDFRSAFAKYLGDKLASKLNVPSIQVPWSQMTAEDIINWPQGVEFKPVKKMNREELKKLHELAKEDQLDFSPEFIEGMTGDTKIISMGDRERKELRSAIVKYLRNKLASKLNVPSMQVPWSQMKAGDIINWPQGVEFKNVWVLNLNEVKSLQNMVKQDKLDFSPEFLKRQLAKTKSSAPELH